MPHDAPISPSGDAEFSRTQRAALVEAVACHDLIDLDATLPSALHLDYDAALLARCYRLSLALWRDVDRAAFARLVTRIARGGRLGPADARALKDVRARAKQLRFAAATLHARGGYPPRLDRATRLMGQIQDAARSDRRGRAALRAVLLRLLVTRSGAAAILHECAAIAPDPAALRTHLAAEMRRVRDTARQPEITNQRFHETRKIVSRLVAFFDTLTVLAPSPYHRQVDRFLGTINGLMGALHDDMVARKASRRRDYHRVAEPLARDIADRLRTLVDAFAAGGLSELRDTGTG